MKVNKLINRVSDKKKKEALLCSWIYVELTFPVRFLILHNKEQKGQYYTLFMISSQ